METESGIKPHTHSSISVEIVNSLIIARISDSGSACEKA